MKGVCFHYRLLTLVLSASILLLAAEWPVVRAEGTGDETIPKAFPTATPIPGDLNQDNVVGPEDLIRFRDCWSMEGAGPIITIELPAVWRNKMRLIRIPKGSFDMGSPGGERDLECYDGYNDCSDEFPQHRVTITKDFYIGETEVTQDQWAAVSGPSGTPDFSSFCGRDPQKPVYGVRWSETQIFLSNLSFMTGKVFRLPTEAEWEYAARGSCGNPNRYGPFSFGDDPTIPLPSCMESGLFDRYMYWCGNNEDPHAPACSPSRVAQKEPNDYGLYDMHGNMNEWCEDWYQPDFYGRLEATLPDPVCEDSSSGSRVMRSGCYACYLDDCRTAARFGAWPDGLRFEQNGFRVVMDAEE
jgi:formylglycine-generating enzyme required for sulfatase activity